MSPSVVWLSSSFCASTLPDEYMYSLNCSSCSCCNTGITSSNNLKHMRYTCNDAHHYEQLVSHSSVWSAFTDIWEKCPSPLANVQLCWSCSTLVNVPKCWRVLCKHLLIFPSTGLCCDKLSSTSKRWLSNGVTLTYANSNARVRTKLNMKSLSLLILMLWPLLKLDSHTNKL